MSSTVKCVDEVDFNSKSSRAGDSTKSNRLFPKRPPPPLPTQYRVNTTVEEERSKAKAAASFQTASGLYEMANFSGASSSSESSRATSLIFNKDSDSHQNVKEKKVTFQKSASQKILPKFPNANHEQSSFFSKTNRKDWDDKADSVLYYGDDVQHQAFTVQTKAECRLNNLSQLSFHSDNLRLSHRYVTMLELMSDVDDDDGTTSE